jgi:hypothetical protein
MNDNPYIQYYYDQAGSGVAGFEGVQYQRGHGFFGRLFGSIIRPLLGYLGKLGLSTGVNVASDYLEGKNIKEAAQDRLKEAGKTALAAGIKRGETFLQTGKGRRKRKRKASVKKSSVQFPNW